MKKVSIILFLVLSSILLAEVTDIAGKGKYNGYRKIVGHELEKRFIIYFKVDLKNNVSSKEIISIPLYPGVNLKEKITLKMPDGEKRIATRENWYKVFRKLKPHSKLSNYFDDTCPKLYNEWWDAEVSMDGERLATKYIDEVYLPKHGINNNYNRFSVKEINVTVE